MLQIILIRETSIICKLMGMLLEEGTKENQKEIRLMGKFNNSSNKIEKVRIIKIIRIKINQNNQINKIIKTNRIKNKLQILKTKTNKRIKNKTTMIEISKIKINLKNHQILKINKRMLIKTIKIQNKSKKI